MKLFSIPKQDFKKIVSVFLRQNGLFIFFVFTLYFDGTHFAENYFNIQIAFNVFALLCFSVMFYRATKKIREFMVYAVIIGFFVEHLFSRILEMYTYRLENVPLYVPLGHAVLYARVLRSSKDSLVRKYHKAIEEFFALVIGVFSMVYLIAFGDVFGFVMTVGVFLLLYKRPKDCLFFYTMYILVAILEIGGTAFEVWKWPPIAFNVFEFLPSHNPPSGISLFYFLLDVSCFFVYILVNRKVWSRLQNVKRIRSQKQ